MKGPIDSCARIFFVVVNVLFTREINIYCVIKVIVGTLEGCVF